MKDVFLYVKLGITALGGCLGWFFGEQLEFLYVLIAFILADYLLGVMCGIAEKKLSSDIGTKGIFRKIVVLILVGVANLIDTKIIGEGGIFRTSTIFFYLSNEGISIIENSARLGIPIPGKLKNVLEKLKEEK